MEPVSDRLHRGLGIDHACVLARRRHPREEVSLKTPYLERNAPPQPDNAMQARYLAMGMATGPIKLVAVSLPAIGEIVHARQNNPRPQSQAEAIADATNLNRKRLAAIRCRDAAR